MTRTAGLLFALAIAALVVPPALGAEGTSGGSDRWTRTPNMLAARRDHTATLLGDGRVLVAGGCTRPAGGEECPTNSAELYDPASNTWSRTGSMAEKRIFHSATLLDNGKVLVAGGCSTLPKGDGCPNRTSELFDPRTGKWTKTGDLKQGMLLQTATAIPRGPSALCGQNCGAVLLVPPVTATPEIYNPKAGTWDFIKPTNDKNPFAPILNARFPVGGFTSSVLPSGRVLVISTSYSMFDPVTGLLTPYEDRPLLPRADHTATVLKNGSVLFAGGFNAATGGLEPSAEIYVPESSSAPSKAKAAWRPAGAMKTPRAFHRAALLSDGRVLIAGGRGAAPGVMPQANTPSTAPLDGTELFDPKTLEWSQGPKMLAFHGPGPQPDAATLSRFTATALKDGRVLIAGGVTDDSNAKNPQQAAEIFTPSGFKGPKAMNPESSGPTANRLGSSVSVPIAAGVVFVLLLGLWVALRNQFGKSTR